MACDISIIVPVYNEEGNVLPLTQEVIAALRDERWTFELVFVDDASTDATWPQIQEVRRLHSEVRGLRHVQNAGQSAALWTGIQATSSDIIATMDGDRQNDPADLPKLLAALETCDFASGLREKRKDNFSRRFAAAVARHARRMVLKVDFVDTGCGLRAFRRTTLRGLFPFNGLHRFLPVLVHGGGARTREIPVNHRPRVAGKSKYGIWDRLGRGIIDLLAIAWYQRRRLPFAPTYETTEKDRAGQPRVYESTLKHK